MSRDAFTYIESTSVSKQIKMDHEFAKAFIIVPLSLVVDILVRAIGIYMLHKITLPR